MAEKYIWGGGTNTPDPVTNAKLNQNVEYLEERIDSVEGGEGKISVGDGGTPIEDVTSITFSGATVTDNTGGSVTVTGLKGDPGTPGAPGTPGTPGSTGAKGDDGASAYEVAVANGFIGTEAEWLASLKGEPGDGGGLSLSQLQEQILGSIIVSDGEVITSDGKVLYVALED